MGAGGPLAGLGPAARACLGAGLVDRPLEPLEAKDLAGEAEQLISESMAPVALALAAQVPGLERETFERFRLVTVEMQMRAMSVTAAARRILAELYRLEIPAAVIKGPAVAPFQPDGWPRGYTDIDLLVPRQWFGEVVRISRDLRFTEPSSTPPWPWFDAVCKEGLNLRSADGGNIDVHHHVPPWVFGTCLTPDNVLDHATWAKVGGVRVRTASPEHSLIIASLHVLNDLWKGRIGLVSWRDIVVLLRRLGAERAATAFDDVRLGWLGTLVVSSLRRALPEAEIPVPVPARPVPVAVRARMAALGWNNDSTFSRLRVSFAARLPAPQASAFLAGCVVPQPLFVRQYHGTYRRYWRSLLGETVSTVRGEDPRMNSVRMTKLEP